MNMVHSFAWSVQTKDYTLNKQSAERTQKLRPEVKDKNYSTKGKKRFIFSNNKTML